MDIIQDALGTALTFPDGYKPPMKGENTKKYSGSPKYSELEVWLVMLVHRYALQQLGGGNANTDRVRLLSLLEYLDGMALTWFNNHVLNSKRTVVYWTFCDAITALYLRFVHPSTMHEARESFRSVKYTHELGIQGYFDLLVEHGMNMVVFPDQQTILDEFLKGIPQETRSRCFREFGMNPQCHDVGDFVAAAVRIERGNQAESYYNTAVRGRASGSSYATAAKTKNVGTPANRYAARPKPSQYTPRTTNENKEVSKPTPYKNTSKPRAQSAPKATQQIPQKRYENTKTTMEPGNCYNCDEPGHFAHECKKEKRKRVFLKAVHTIAEVDEEEEADDESPRHDEGPTENENMEEREEEAELHEVEVPASEFYEGHGQYDYEADFIHGMDVVPTMKTSEDDDASVSGKPPPTEYSIPRIVAVQEKERRDVKETSHVEQKSLENIRKYKLIKTGRSRLRPAVTADERECLTTWVQVGGMKAWTLWDSGSTMTGITPAYAEIAKIKIDTLEDPHILQLGTVGSRSTIKYGADVNIQVANTSTISYLDIANLDRYDMVVGTPWMRKHKVLLDFTEDRVIINGVPIPAIKVREKNLDTRIHRHRATEKMIKDE